MQECQRCGTCCRKGPPALHDSDREIYLCGVLCKEHLITLRKGEYVYDNIQDCIQQLDQDLIRIRPKESSKACFFLNEANNDCEIYLHRPLECRVMKCWDNQDIIDTYAHSRIERKDLIPEHSALYEIILEHESKCSVQAVEGLARRFKKEENNEYLIELSQILDTDCYIRKFLQNKAGAGASSLEFVLGRSLDKVLPNLGLKVEVGETGYKFQRVFS